MSAVRLSLLWIPLFVCLARRTSGLPSVVKRDGKTELFTTKSSHRATPVLAETSTATSDFTEEFSVTSVAVIKSTTEQPMTSVSIHVTSDGPCFDLLGEACFNYADEKCFLIYEPWARAHCALRCGYCKGEINCTDKLNNCGEFGIGACKQYPQWGRQNCRKFCDLCSPPTYYDTSATPVMTEFFSTEATTEAENDTECRDRINNCDDYDDIKCFGQYEPWARVRCALRCGYCTPATVVPCTDKLDNCTLYGKSACSQYPKWGRQNCKKYCQLCDPPKYIPATGNPGSESGNFSESPAPVHDTSESTAQSTFSEFPESSAPKYIPATGNPGSESGNFSESPESTSSEFPESSDPAKTVLTVIPS